MSTIAFEFIFITMQSFLGQDFLFVIFVIFSLGPEKPALGCMSLLPYRFLPDFKTQIYELLAVECAPDPIQTKDRKAVRRFLGNAGRLLFVLPSPLWHRFGSETLNHISNLMLMFHIRSLKNAHSFRSLN